MLKSARNTLDKREEKGVKETGQGRRLRAKQVHFTVFSICVYGTLSIYPHFQFQKTSISYFKISLIYVLLYRERTEL